MPLPRLMMIKLALAISTGFRFQNLDIWVAIACSVVATGFYLSSHGKLLRGVCYLITWMARHGSVIVVKYEYYNVYYGHVISIMAYYIVCHNRIIVSINDKIGIGFADDATNLHCQNEIL
jgi:hypothetical protein